MTVTTDVKEIIMAEVCAVCHWSYIETDQMTLDDRCVKCPVEKVLEVQLRSDL